MPNHHKTTPDRMVHIRAYLEKKSKKELVHPAAGPGARHG